MRVWKFEGASVAAAAIIAWGLTTALALGWDMRQLLDRADTNRDNLISREEFDQVRSDLFSRLDRNGDGAVLTDDAPRRIWAGREARDRLAQFVSLLDTDGDGRLTRDEFLSGPGHLFGLADRNGDNLIDPDERHHLRTAVERFGR